MKTNFEACGHQGMKMQEIWRPVHSWWHKSKLDQKIWWFFASDEWGFGKGMAPYSIPKVVGWRHQVFRVLFNLCLAFGSKVDTQEKGAFQSCLQPIALSLKHDRILLWSVLVPAVRSLQKLNTSRSCLYVSNCQLTRWKKRWWAEVH